MPRKFKIAIQTEDMRMYYKLMKYLKAPRLMTRFFAIDQIIPIEDFDLIITTTESNNKIETNTKIINLKSDDIEPSIVPRIIGLIVRKKASIFKKLIIGIDPGKTIGLAAVCDGMLLYATTTKLDTLINKLKDIVVTFPSEEIIIRIGNQPHYVSNIIFNKLFSFVGSEPNFTLEIVEESFTTSKKVKLKQQLGVNEEAAYSIAQRSGKQYSDMVRNFIPKGHIKEIKNWSRQRSDNRLTVDSQLAEAIALGDITLDDAILEKKKKIVDDKKEKSDEEDKL